MALGHGDLLDVIVKVYLWEHGNDWKLKLWPKIVELNFLTDENEEFEESFVVLETVLEVNMELSFLVAFSEFQSASEVGLDAKRNR